MQLLGTAIHDGTVPIGRPLANTTVYVVDNQLEPVPIGVTGELLIGGAGVARGYLKRPELTSERFLDDPFADAAGARLYRTGDLVQWRRDGALQFVGRRDSQIKLRGHRIELGEIEAALNRHPAVRRSAVVMREAAGEKRLVAYLTPASGQRAKPADLRTFLARSLPEVMIPSAFVELQEFPTLPNGKINLHALPEPASTRPELGMEYVAPESPTERNLARIWSEILGIEEVGIHDSFLELGGDSLSAVELILRVEQEFGSDLPLHRLFAGPTIAEIAEFIGR
jgi:acyl-CoA synthetase (AMP-forming)/AMP-acid ligase II/acyl carrier protein